MKNQKAVIALRETSPARIFARPTADDLWLGPAQESALRQLSVRRPVRVLLGPQSSGRSCVLRCLAAASDRGLLSLRARGPLGLRNALLRALIDSAQLNAEQLRLADMRKLLVVFIREQLARGRRVILQIDDADSLSPAAFAELIRLRDVFPATAARPELLLALVHLDKGSSPAADFVRACDGPEIAVLSWLNPTEVHAYVHWRLERYGLGGIFSSAATMLIAQCTRGCFAAVDHLCQMALLLLRNRDADQVDVLLVREAIRALRRQHLRRDSGSAATPEAELIVTRDGELLHRLAVGERLLLGRGHLNDISLDSSYLSRHHVAIIRGTTGYFLSDLNSVNGVLLNGQRVQSAPVGNGDVIRIGPYRLKLNIANELPRNSAGQEPDELADTVVMPTPEMLPEPAFLKLIK